MDFGKIFMRQGILLGHFLCDRVQGVESFATHPRHFPSHTPPPGSLLGKVEKRLCYEYLRDWKGNGASRFREDQVNLLMG